MINKQNEVNSKVARAVDFVQNQQYQKFCQLVNDFTKPGHNWGNFIRSLFHNKRFYTDFTHLVQCIDFLSRSIKNDDSIQNNGICARAAANSIAKPACPAIWDQFLTQYLAPISPYVVNKKAVYFLQNRIMNKFEITINHMRANNINLLWDKPVNSLSTFLCKEIRSTDKTARDTVQIFYENNLIDKEMLEGIILKQALNGIANGINNVDKPVMNFVVYELGKIPKNYIDEYIRVFNISSSLESLTRL